MRMTSCMKLTMGGMKWRFRITNLSLFDVFRSANYH